MKSAVIPCFTFWSDLEQLAKFNSLELNFISSMHAYILMTYAKFEGKMTPIDPAGPV